MLFYLKGKIQSSVHIHLAIVWYGEVKQIYIHICLYLFKETLEGYRRNELVFK
jgi:hypothetical protein